MGQYGAINMYRVAGTVSLLSCWLKYKSKIDYCFHFYEYNYYQVIKTMK